MLFSDGATVRRTVTAYRTVVGVDERACSIWSDPIRHRVDMLRSANGVLQSRQSQRRGAYIDSTLRAVPGSLAVRDGDHVVPIDCNL